MAVRRTLFLGLLLSLAACSGSEQGTAGEDEARPASRLPADNVFSGQVRALEKAEGLEQTLREAEQRQRRQIEQQTR
ncbi:hypothetical protein QVG61_02005 [Thiohalobacter sp. IOR34]|uniref:hypothetical protein n=1 Tax=Thiohalobacter sp. IOR34 TaxID=3057176 RepID=UPI0025AFF0CD|nr:hypothetical protein [Thiohalobacter sp. IOR34]WJW75885.1 hypothetical protein QVG61_02005 [Thiohalobacter sp. IOR34]